MLLPTQYYAVGTMLAVTLSFLILMSRAISKTLERGFQWRGDLMRVPTGRFKVLSLVSTTILFCGIYIGYFASSDPLSNLLPLGIWTGWWTG